LLASAGRLYGDQMERLWGEMLPVPEDRLRVLRGGERIGPFEVAYTPGHASHHVSYMHEASRRVFTGDVTGVRIDGGPVMPPTPPPDIDIPAWRRSLELIESWQPSSIAFTHFGESGDVGGHLRSLREHLDVVERLAGELDEEGFMAQLGTHLRELVGTELAETYARAMPPEQSYAGLARYIAKRDAAES
jgi:glyoxylase-like metal-dependent hydrolase (beta-lactamase superfamily II)